MFRSIFYFFYKTYIVRTCGIEPHRGKFLSACQSLFQVYHSCTRCAIYTADKQSCHLHVHRGMQDATSGIFKPYLFATFFRLYYFPFCAPPSSDCTLPNFGFITTCRISQCRRTRTTTDRTKICCATITPYIGYRSFPIVRTTKLTCPARSTRLFFRALV